MNERNFFENILNGSYKNPNTGNIVRIDQIGNHFRYHYKDLYDKIKSLGISVNNYVYNVINDIDDTPRCHCGNKLKFITLNDGYRKYCSQQCQLMDLHKSQRKNGWSFKSTEVLYTMK